METMRASLDTERADVTRGDPHERPLASAKSRRSRVKSIASTLREQLGGAVCGYCRKNRATVLRGEPGAHHKRCATCAADEARVERLRQVRKL